MDNESETSDYNEEDLDEELKTVHVDIHSPNTVRRDLQLARTKVMTKPTFQEQNGKRRPYVSPDFDQFAHLLSEKDRDTISIKTDDDCYERAKQKALLKISGSNAEATTTQTHQEQAGSNAEAMTTQTLPEQAGMEPPLSSSANNVTSASGAALDATRKPANAVLDANQTLYELLFATITILRSSSSVRRTEHGPRFSYQL